MVENIRTGLCPKCGKRLQIPGELEAFSCMYCGERMGPEALLPEQEAPVSQDAAMEAFRSLREGLLPCVTEHLGAFQNLTAKAYPAYFQGYLDSCRPVLELLPLAAQAKPGEGEPLPLLAQSLVDGLGAWSKRARRGLTTSDAMLEDAKATVCLVMIPAIRSLDEPAGEAFCQIFREKWLERYPKKLFQLATYQQIAQGFRRRKLCFITTAVCRQEGKPDDCPELTAFRAFRDGYLQAQPQGQKLIGEYYRLAPGIVTAIDLMDDPDTVYPSLWETYLAPCYDALSRGEHETCQSIYTHMVETLAEKYLAIRPFS
ncbi:MAG: CFI-box-CTERM domain-containing protein [Candidatus Faecousia sp.]|nr:CFI-box-CTERM domain-containing protein [Candidatus Faecousia sp.]